MKKQIALLAALVAASGMTAYGQDWILFGTGNTGWVYDEFTTPGVGVLDGAAGSSGINVAFLWNANTSASDQLGSVGSSFGQHGGAANDQVATNGVSSVGSANPLSTIASMLSAGWQLGANLASGNGTATTGTVVTPAGSIGTKFGGIPAYNQGNAFEISSTTTGTPASDGGNIEMIVIAWNASAGSSYTSATALGWSNPFTEEFGTSPGDLDVGPLESSDAMNQFGVAPVPEPTTLALAGLGGLSMLFLRRRKA
jgi:hypothetical protein